MSIWFGNVLKKKRGLKMEAIAESLFYSGGTITTDDIIQTSDTCKYDIALNSDHMFLFKKGSTKILKVVKVERQTEFTYKIMKTKVKICGGFAGFVKDDVFRFMVRDALDNIVKITRGV